MKFAAMLMLAFLSLSTSAWAATESVRCPVTHFVRAGGSEIRSASIVFRNGDPEHAATIESLTIYDVFGVVVHHSVAHGHPLNTDFTPALDITFVPPNASYYLRTNHIWGNNSIPDMDGINGNQRGQTMSALVEFSKGGKRDLFVVTTRPRSRERLVTPSGASEGAERSSDTGACFSVQEVRDR